MTDKHKQRAKEHLAAMGLAWNDGLVTLVALAISEAVAEERERCAKVAEDFPWASRQHTDRDLQASIAAKIREGA